MCNLMLTNSPCGGYVESLKLVHTAFTPRQSVFFVPMAWMIAGNILNTGRALMYSFSESTPLSFLVAILEKVHKMTTLKKTHDAYLGLRIVLQNLNDKDFNSDIDDASGYVCQALNDLEAAIAYIPIEDIKDRKIKLEILKKIITELAEDGDGNIDLDKLDERSRAQLALTLQLIKE